MPNLLLSLSKCRPLAATKYCLSPERGVWSLPSSQPEMDSSCPSPPRLRTFPLKEISKQYAVNSKQRETCKLRYRRLHTAYCLLALCGSKETTPPSPGSKDLCMMHRSFSLRLKTSSSSFASGGNVALPVFIEMD
jgi:hypothetical protein